MTRSNQIKCDLRTQLNTILPSYLEEAPIEAQYPYIEFSWDVTVRPGEGVSRGTVDIHVWDNSDGYGKCDEALDNVESLLDGDIFGTDAQIYTIRGTRSHLPNNDATIKHAHEVFDVSIYD